MARTFAIGDIHGALKALKQLIYQFSLQPSDTLIFLGDYVDGWPESASVITYLIELDKQYSCIFIKGNHDAWCEDWLAGSRPDNNWLIQGGESTVRSYESGTVNRETHLAFFRSMRSYYIDDTNRLFVHAGFCSMHGPEMEHYNTNFYWDRTLWETAMATDKRIHKDSERYPKRLLLFNEIYIGHTPTINYDVKIPIQACNVWNIDTGAAFYGKLSAIDIHTKQTWQSDVVQRLYPTEKGRNK